MNKKIVLFLLALTLTLSVLFSGCVAAEPEGQDTDGAVAENEEQDAESGSASEEPAEPEEPEDEDTDGSEESEIGKLTVVSKNESVNVEQESGPFVVKVNKMQLASLEVSEDYKDMFDKDLVTVVTLEVEVENKSSDTNSMYPDQGTIVTNTKEQKDAEMFFSDDVGGDFIGEVTKKGNVVFILDSAAEEVTSFKYIIDAPHDDEFNSLGEDITFELSF